MLYSEATGQKFPRRAHKGLCNLITLY
jgi:hypothetical protein